MYPKNQACSDGMIFTEPGYEQLSADYQRIEQAIFYLCQHYREQPSLSEIARTVNLSEYHFQRIFTNWAGISPKRFVQYLTKEEARQLLKRSADLLDVTYQVGLSSPGRLHDLFVTWEAVTPGEYKKRGAGLVVLYGFHPSPFGECLIGLTERGICSLQFTEGLDHELCLANLQQEWPRAYFKEAAAHTAASLQCVFSRQQGRLESPLSLLLSGTQFQLKVWEALLQIPPGRIISYEMLAASIGHIGAERAVGNAIGRNPVAVLIPCHRVIRKMGEYGNYRYGVERKQALLGWELSRYSG